MKRVIILAAALLCTIIPVQAAGVFTKNELEGSPYAVVLNQRLQLLDSMSNLLNQVNDTASANAAAPRLLRKAEQFMQLQETAETAKEASISRSSQLRYIRQMEQSLNAFRLTCLRVAQEKCYGSTALRQAVFQISQSF